MHWFPDNDEAGDWLEKQIEAKTKLGYVEKKTCAHRVGSTTGPKRGDTAASAAATVESDAMRTKPKQSGRKSQVAKTWSAIEEWFSAHTPDESVPLPCGVPQSDLDKAESKLSVRFPRDLRDAWSVHNGTGAMAFIFGRLLPLSEIVEMWAGFKRGLKLGYYEGRTGNPRGPIKSVWIDLKWIPIAADDEGGFLFVDLVPAKGGKKGQVIQFSRQEGPTDALADSLLAFLQIVARDLQKGKYQFDKKRWVLKAT
jgi:cell wall assembly regulator SMI1